VVLVHPKKKQSKEIAEKKLAYTCSISNKLNLKKYNVVKLESYCLIFKVNQLLE